MCLLIIATQRSSPVSVMMIPDSNLKKNFSLKRVSSKEVWAALIAKNEAELRVLRPRARVIGIARRLIGCLTSMWKVARHQRRNLFLRWKRVFGLRRIDLGRLMTSVLIFSLDANGPRKLKM